MQKILIGALTACLLVLPACSRDEGKAPKPLESTTTVVSKEAVAATAHSAAEAIKASIPEVTELLDLNEDNDKNQLLGRPNGYLAATILVDKRVSSESPECDPKTPGADCGATIEQWPSEAGAQQRADYINNLYKSLSMLSGEYTTVRGNLLLRVSGKMKPTDADAYQSTFLG